MSPQLPTGTRPIIEVANWPATIQLGSDLEPTPCHFEIGMGPVIQSPRLFWMSSQCAVPSPRNPSPVKPSQAHRIGVQCGPHPPVCRNNSPLTESCLRSQRLGVCFGPIREICPAFSVLLPVRDPLRLVDFRVVSLKPIHPHKTYMLKNGELPVETILKHPR